MFSSTVTKGTANRRCGVIKLQHTAPKYCQCIKRQWVCLILPQFANFQRWPVLVSDNARPPTLLNLAQYFQSMGFE